MKALQQRRAELTECGSGLQRWAVALSLEAARQAEAAKALRDLEEHVRRPPLITQSLAPYPSACGHARLICQFLFYPLT